MNDDNDRHILALPGLPVAMGEEARLGINLKQPGFRGRNIESARNKRGCNGHRVAIS